MSARYVDEDQQLQELLALREQDPLLRPQAIVDRARDKRSALHSEFTWDNRQAAEERRLDQARALVRKFRLRIPEMNTDVRRFVSVETSDGRGYIPTEEVLQSPFLTQQALDRMAAELRSLEARYKHFAEAAEIIGPIREWLERRESA